MIKQKSDLQPFSQYAIIDLPIEICIQRATEFCANKSFGEAHMIDDDRLDIVYEFDNLPPLDGVASITRWQGTQTRVALHEIIEDEPYDDVADFSLDFIKIMGFMIVMIIGVMLPTDLHALGFIGLVAIGLAVSKYLSTLNIKVYREQPMDTSDYLQTEWDVLLVMLASDDTGIMSSLVEQGEPQDLYQADYQREEYNHMSAENN